MSPWRDFLRCRLEEGVNLALRGRLLAKCWLQIPTAGVRCSFGLLSWSRSDDFSSLCGFTFRLGGVYVYFEDSCQPLGLKGGSWSLGLVIKLSLSPVELQLCQCIAACKRVWSGHADYMFVFVFVYFKYTWRLGASMAFSEQCPSDFQSVSRNDCTIGPYSLLVWKCSYSLMKA